MVEIKGTKIFIFKFKMAPFSWGKKHDCPSLQWVTILQIRKQSSDGQTIVWGKPRETKGSGKRGHL